MMAEVEPDHWVAPSLEAPSTFLEPLQGGGAEAARHAEALGADALLRAGGAARPAVPTDRRASTAAPTAAPRHHQLPRDGRHACWLASKGGDAIVAVDPAAVAPTVRRRVSS